MSIIHVNSHVIRSNKKHSAEAAPLTLRRTRSGPAEYCHAVEILDSSGAVVATVVYQPGHPLSCGATVWIETENPARSAEPRFQLTVAEEVALDE